MTESATLGAGRLQPPEQSPWDDTTGRFRVAEDPAPCATVVHEDLTLLPIVKHLLAQRATGARGRDLLATWRKLATTVALIEERKRNA